MLSVRHGFMATLIALAIGAGCTINENSTPAAVGNDGTKPIDTSQATALVTGQVDNSVQGDVQFNVNATSRNVVIAPDQSFVVRDVPTGDVTLACNAGDVRGTLTITDVKPGEIIDVSVRREGDAIVIATVQRTASTAPPREVDAQSGDALTITASHVCYWFKPGHYKQDVVVSGSDVHLFGAAHASCVVDDLTFLDGKLDIRGDHVSVLDVELTGNLEIGGKNARIQDTCTRCFGVGCQHACDKDDTPHGQCGRGDADAGVSIDSGVTAQDASSSPADDASTNGG